MFAHVRSCSACSACSQLVQGMFTRPEHAKHAIDCKNGNYFSDHVSFQHFILRHVQRLQHPKLNGKEKLVMGFITLLLLLLGPTGTIQHRIQHRTAGTIQLRMAGLERNYYPTGKCDS